MTDTTTEIADRIRRLSDAFERKVASVPADRWASPSPCAGWDARDVVRHVVDVHAMMLKPTGRPPGPAPSVDDDPLEAFRRARADVAAVLADPVLAGTEYDGFFGRTRVERTIDDFLGFDLVVHGWDLARAAGLDDTIEPGEVARLAGMAEQLGDTMRTSGAFGPQVAAGEDESPQDRLLGLLGRVPR
jgi:uncharacterized protein (TIGR03086 family)